jgi:O-antigen ligase
VKACADKRVPAAILVGMAIGLCMEAFVVVWQRFGLGVIQTTGTFPHQNSLGLASHFVVFPVFALLLAGQQGWQTYLAPAAGAVVAVLTASRATLGLNAAGLALVFAFSAMRRWSSRKAKVMLLGVAVVVALTPIALSSYERRFAAVPLSDDYDERAAFERAASMILADHPLGVGANNYVVVANAGGYMDRARVAFTSRSTSVHNAYWLTAAELGYFGLFGFIALLARLTTRAFVIGWRNRNDSRGDLLLGLGVSILMMSIHCYFEWIIFVGPIQYLLALNAGLIGGLVSQLANERSRTQPSYLRAGDERIGSDIRIGNNALRINKPR